MWLHSVTDNWYHCSPPSQHGWIMHIFLIKLTPLSEMKCLSFYVAIQQWHLELQSLILRVKCLVCLFYYYFKTSMTKIAVVVHDQSHSKVFLQQNPTCTWNYTVEVTIRQQEIYFQCSLCFLLLNELLKTNKPSSRRF